MKRHSPSQDMKMSWQIVFIMLAESVPPVDVESELLPLLISWGVFDFTFVNLVCGTSNCCSVRLPWVCANKATCRDSYGSRVHPCIYLHLCEVGLNGVFQACLSLQLLCGPSGGTLICSQARHDMYFSWQVLDLPRGPQSSWTCPEHLKD